MPNLVSKQAAARSLDVSAKTIDRLIARGELEAVKLTPGPQGRVRIPAESLERFVTGRRG